MISIYCILKKTVLFLYHPVFAILIVFSHVRIKRIMTSIQILITKSTFRAKVCKLKKKTVSVSAQQEYVVPFLVI